MQESNKIKEPVRKLVEQPMKKKEEKKPLTIKEKVQQFYKNKKIMEPNELRRIYSKEDLKEIVRYLKDEDSQPVKGIFDYKECNGGNIKFSYRKYPGESVEKYHLYDGQTYTIPLGVARHLNKEGWYPVHEHSVDEDGKPTSRVGTKTSRFSFQSQDFINVGEVRQDQQIVTVERV